MPHWGAVAPKEKERHGCVINIYNSRLPNRFPVTGGIHNKTNMTIVIQLAAPHPLTVSHIDINSTGTRPEVGVTLTFRVGSGNYRCVVCVVHYDVTVGISDYCHGGGKFSEMGKNVGERCDNLVEILQGILRGSLEKDSESPQ